MASAAWALCAAERPARASTQKNKALIMLRGALIVIPQSQNALRKSTLPKKFEK
jgi:hypothetical protein